MVSLKMAIQILLAAIGLSCLQMSLAATTPTNLTISTKCTRICGGVMVLFPFGIGTGCFLSDWYEIECQQNGTIPILKKINLEVLNISIGSSSSSDDEATITVKLPTFDSSSSNCKGNRTNAPVSFEGSEFYFSPTRNVFIAIGCNVLSVVDDTQSSVVGCKSSCIQGRSSTYSNCTGVDDCCRTNVPYHQRYKPGFSKDITNASGDEDEGCRYAFLVDESWLGQGKIDLSTLKLESYLPAVLEWGIPGDDDYNSIYSDHFHMCSYHYAADGIMIRQCFCFDGYRGNPYLDDGCQDINECEDPTLHKCPGRCVNRIGTFDCVDRARIPKLVGIGISGGLVALLSFVLLWYLWRFIKRRKEAKRKERFFKKNGGLLLQQQLSSLGGNLHKGKIFSSIELEKATDNFNESRILGKGGQGTVYKGMLTNGKIVAVKKAMAMDERNIDTFVNEVIILSQINHRNVVKLLGCCLETEVPLLVYEFIPNGTLYHYIQNPTEFSMSWDMRLHIASDVAGALAYLHSSASLPVYHRDVKSSNILLDEKYRAKIADFGKSRFVPLDQTHVTTLIQGTFGYMDPEFFRSGQFTDKSDVYSFGVVIVELLTGQKPIPLFLRSEGKSLAMHFTQSMEEGCLFDILDAEVMQQGKKEDIIDVANLARECLNLEGRKRPKMKDVALELDRIRKVEERAREDNDHCVDDVLTVGAIEIEADVIPISVVQTQLPSYTW